MLVVTVDLAPGGDESRRRTIATMYVSNGSNLADVSDYLVTAMEAASPLTGNPAGIVEVKVLSHERKQRVWALLQRASEELMKADWVEL
ncbi:MULTISPECIES: hypothetical protein [Bradyrhizobium]|jgi:hypothetical protein|uniref:hypothetical protein n=1 Tax=Bradyrhizobium TaxID=374 RepID=UPI000FAAD1B5|nr:hypothetical protein [Bradyrhizobium denitrificans]MCL8483400.1 hypothetical protein [Bradyrhizobium denitrificans]RTM01317.1 MAG: hypothetical protein EKK32_13440 [Bradyrhizobiaceae bacterium]